jgi:hypothetical protein
LSAKRESVFDGTNRLGQAKRVIAFGLQDMEGQALRRFLADAR